jgi:RimJ/RimL family protein N-acetyltransferase
VSVRLRPAAAGDVDLVFGWRNDPFIVARGSSQRTVTRQEHERWFAETLSRSDRLVFIIEHEGVSAGQIRFDRVDEHRCVVSVYLLEKYVGRGLGVDAIRIGCTDILARWSVDAVIACVRQGNDPGRRAFLKAGFVVAASSEPACSADHHALRLARPA